MYALQKYLREKVIADLNVNSVAPMFLFCVCIYMYGSESKILGLIILSSDEDSGVPAHMRRLARVFDARINKVWMNMKTQIKC